MPLFRYEALDRTGNTVRGAMQVADERVLTARLATMGYQPLSIEVAGGSSPRIPSYAGSAPVYGAPAGPVSNLSAGEREIARMFHQLYLSFRAGMPAFQALSTVGEQVRSSPLRSALGEIANGVRDGERLSVLMERFPRMFSRGDVGMVRAAEMGGFLPEALEALSVQHEQDCNTRRRLAIWEWLFHSNALFLPPLIALLSFFGALLRSEGQLGPALWAVGRTFLFVSVPMTLVYLGLVYGFHRLRRSPTFAYRWHRFLLRLPVAAKINFLRANAVFTRVLQQLYQAGVSPASAWDTASGAVPNLYLADRYMQGMPMVESTGRLSVGMQHIGLLSPEDVGMVATGETTGEVPQALDYLANHYEEDTRVALGASVVRGALTMILWGTILTGVGFVAVAVTARGFYDTLLKWATPE